MNKRSRIQVRRYPKDRTHHSCTTYQVIGIIYRVMWAEAIGNFNPMFCRYKNKRHQVFSNEGDLSDPFRRDESYLKTLFIEQEVK